VLTSGSVYDGWIVTISPGITLTEDSANSTNLDLTKSATFTTLAEGLLITFTQQSASAAPTISFQSESVTNSAGSNWGGFEFLLLNPADSASFSGSPFTAATGYTFDSAGSTSTSLIYTGAQAEGTTSLWGTSGNGGALNIAADPTGVGTTFVFKELPLTSAFVTGLPGGGGSPIPVPLPPAVWQGLMGCGCLVLVGLAKRRRQRS
jgi:hypothetical protein